MSRNFEMLQQAEQARDLFQSAVAPPRPPSPRVLPEQAEPEQREAGNGAKDERADKELFNNAHPADVATPSRGAEFFPWLSRLRMGIKLLVTRPNGQTHDGRGSVDCKAMAQQEEIKLVERVFLGPESSSNKVILFSGVDKAEGGARVCAQAALTLAARVQGSVCLLDADVHSRSLQHYLGVRNTPGLAEAVLESAPIRHYAQPLTLSNLWMITCGGDGANTQAALNSERMRIRFEELRRQFDYVLINVPSMGTTSSLMQFAQSVDGVIFVVEANSTRRETTKRFKETLEEVRVRVLGVVLNDRTFPIPESVYRKL